LRYYKQLFNNSTFLVNVFLILGGMGKMAKKEINNDGLTIVEDDFCLAKCLPVTAYNFYLGCLLTICNAFKLRWCLCGKIERAVVVREKFTDEHPCLINNISHDLVTGEGAWAGSPLFYGDVPPMITSYFLGFWHEGKRFQLEVSKSLYRAKKKGSRLVVAGINGRDRWHFKPVYRGAGILPS
jgi:hypothetical protein